MTISSKICAASFVTTDDFAQNLTTLSELLEQSPDALFTLFPEVCLTGFCYERFEEAATFFETAKPTLLGLSKEKNFILTAIEKKDGYFYNTLHFFSGGESLHSRSKHTLFKLGDEHRYFTPGSDQLKILDFQGIKIAFLICFELRFVKFWEALKGADIIVVPAMWGRDRIWQFQNLLQALALSDQCFVISSNAKNLECGEATHVFSPWGEIGEKSPAGSVCAELDLKQLKVQRRYLDLGIK